jgi:DegV family protein with EDD domain
MPEKIALVTDSTCDMTPSALASLGITVVPLTVSFGTEEFTDGVDIDPEAFYERMAAAKELPRTSQPSIGLFLEAYQRLSAAGATHILSLHISSALSGTANAARAAASLVPGCAIEVMDSRTTSAGLALLLEYTKSRIGHEPWEGIIERVRGMTRRIGIFFTVNQLRYLEKGGRIGKARALLGATLGLRPILSCLGSNGEVAPVSRAFSDASAQSELLRLAREWAGPDGPQVGLTFMRSAIPEALLGKLRASLSEWALPGIAPWRETWIGPVIGAHVGPGVWGIAVL